MLSRFSMGTWLSFVLLLYGASAAAENAEELISQARRQFRSGQTAEALQLATAAIAADERHAQAWFVRGVIHEALGRHQEAVADYDQVIKLEGPAASPEVYQRRGCEHFKLAHIEESIADFDKYLQLRPEQERSHWQRGISYYYAGRFADGAKQFEGYQTFDDNDVENAVWRYLCMAREHGVERARDSLLKIKNDPRVPMMVIYRLYAGEAKPDDVLAAANAGKPSDKELNSRLFYAHLYLGLYHEAAGDAAQAREHIEKAVDHKIGHHMWDVAHVHAELMKKRGQKEG
jgi:lipoprotein NlpI